LGGFSGEMPASLLKLAMPKAGPPPQEAWLVLRIISSKVLRLCSLLVLFPAIGRGGVLPPTPKTRFNATSEELVLISRVMPGLDPASQRVLQIANSDGSVPKVSRRSEVAVTAWDFSTMRKFSLYENNSLRIRGEFFNITNRPSFDFSVAKISSGSVGTITTAAEGANLDVLDDLYRRGQFQDVVAQARDLLRRTPGNADLLTRLGAAQFRLGQLGEAERTFRKALVSLPGHAQALLGLGNALLTQGKVSEAVTVFESLSKQVPGHLQLRRTLARAYIEANRFADAEALLQTLVQSDPKDVESWYGLGLLNYRNGYYAAALKALDTALGLSAQHLDARIHRAGALDALGRVAEAEADFQKLLKTPALRTHAGLQLGYGQLLLQSGRNEEALSRFDQAIQLAPESSDAHLWRARALLRIGRVNEAVQAAERAERLSPNAAAPHALLVKLYRLAGNEEFAAKEASWLREYGRRRQ
jgi:tetratricopeptide (TPR) repeat protein